MIWMEVLFSSLKVLLQISPEEIEENHENLKENLPAIPTEYPEVLAEIR
jgi:hypothetical protein